MSYPFVTLLNFGVLIGILYNVAAPSSIIINNASAASLPEDDSNHAAAAIVGEKYYSSSLEKMDINLSPGNEFDPGSKADESALTHCKSLVYRTLKSLPSTTVNKLKNLTLHFDNDGRRGLGGGSTVILRCKNVTDEELVGVLVHEMGHITDTGLMQGSILAGASEFKDGEMPIFRNDMSLPFYRLNFKDEITLKKGSKDTDFVSIYGMSDPFEDFAETYAYYVLHGKEFRMLTKSNNMLKRKYDYMKNYVFGKEYDNGDESFDGNLVKRNYDVTVLPYSLKKFFAV